MSDHTNKIVNHLEMLGLPVEDKVTKFSGVVESVSFDLYGCIQVAIRPTTLKKDTGDMQDGRWFDISRLRVLKSKPVMDRPNYIEGAIADGKHGPAEKPAIR